MGSEHQSSNNPTNLDGFGPLPVVRPGTPAELGEQVRQAAANQQALYPVGGQTQIGVGYTPTRPGIVIDTRSLDRVIDYPARDMTITVQAGITIKALQKQLASENQRLPIDIPRANEATLGGSIAANISGSRRYGFGTLRDHVIGMTVVGDQGQETRSGGRVVKNVAGYDLCKLQIGALGTLGIITQVTLKLWPMLSSRALLSLGCQGADLALLLDQLQASRTRPVCIDLLNTAYASQLGNLGDIKLPATPWIIMVGFEESEASVNWQIQQLMRELGQGQVQGLQAIVGKTGDPLWAGLVETDSHSLAPVHFKANLLPGDIASFCCKATELVPAIQLRAHAGNGIIHGHFNSSSMEQARTILEQLTSQAVASQGNLMILQAPLEWKPHLALWGRPRGDLALMRQIIHRLDPKRLFNPGRFLDRV